MAKRKWTNMQVLESQILAMREAGLSRRMIADELGLELRQIENWIIQIETEHLLLPSLVIVLSSVQSVLLRTLLLLFLCLIVLWLRVLLSSELRLMLLRQLVRSVQVL